MWEGGVVLVVVVVVASDWLELVDSWGMQSRLVSMLAAWTIIPSYSRVVSNGHVHSAHRVYTKPRHKNDERR